MDNPTARPPEPMGQVDHLLYSHRHTCRQDMTGTARYATQQVEHAITAARYCAMPIPRNVEDAATALAAWAESIHETLRRERAERDRAGIDGAHQQRDLERAYDTAESARVGWVTPDTDTAP